MESRKRALLLSSTNDGAAKDAAAAVSSALADLHVELMSTEEVVASSGTSSVTDAIQKADVIVADVTQPRPNVFYELGYAHALRKPTLLLLSTEASGSIPSNLTGYQVLTYDPHNLATLRRHVQRIIEHQMLRLAY